MQTCVLIGLRFLCSFERFFKVKFLFVSRIWRCHHNPWSAENIDLCSALIFNESRRLNLYSHKKHVNRSCNVYQNLSTTCLMSNIRNYGQSALYVFYRHSSVHELVINGFCFTTCNSKHYSSDVYISTLIRILLSKHFFVRFNNLKKYHVIFQRNCNNITWMQFCRQ